MTFKSLGISSEMANHLQILGIQEPTPIQQESIPLIKEGSDVIAKAQTGTGKTLAFLLPIFEKINTDSSFTQALIISPTRELAIQITEEAKKLQHAHPVNVLALYGGQDTSKQLKKLQNKVHLIVATPGRLLDHIERKTVNFSKLSTFVLDEADQMLFMGFRNEIDSIFRILPKQTQLLCFSATIDSKVKKVAYRYMKKPQVVDIETNSVTVENIKQEVVETTDRTKQQALFNILEEDMPFMAIIFCRTKRRADLLEVAMKKEGYNFRKIHSDVLQSKRERIMKSFRSGDIQYLIATDVASRGIDVTGVTHIYNYDMPETVEEYIHRIGRTARAGESGHTCAFVTPKNLPMLQEIEKHIGFSIPRRASASF